MLHLMLGISAPINDGNQHDKQIDKTQCLKAIPQRRRARCSSRAANQFSRVFRSQLRNRCWRLGVIHDYLSDSRKINPSISRTGSGLSPLPWQRPPRHRPESGA
jgi:hypothetical protein